MSDVRLVENNDEWENFVQRQPFTPFVQSYHYGEFYRQMGEQYWIFGVYDGGMLIGGGLVVSTHAKRGNFLYVPYGPILEAGRGDLFKIWVKSVAGFGKKNKFHFLRVSPFFDETSETLRLFLDSGFKNAPMHMIAETTWMLDLNEKEEDLLAKMNKNHRNLIRRCAKEGVVIKISADAAALDRFNEMHNITAKRHNFTRFSENYIRAEYNEFAPSGLTAVLEAYLPDGRLDSSAVIMFYGNMACYRHGASLNLDKRLPTSYLLQWKSIEESRKRGIVWYNFWGIAPDGAKSSHPFFGITHFKKGFGGFQKNLLCCQDLSLSWYYWTNWLVETIRRKKRGFKE